MEQTNNENSLKTEVFGGVTVVHTGKFVDDFGGFQYDEYGRAYTDGLRKVEILEYYDEFGNKFRTNISKSSADEFVSKLAEEGITAVIGPAAPWRNNKGLNASGPDVVGIYIVKQDILNQDESVSRQR